ncbi:adenylate/guanylate cyclase domain-containing protein [Bacteroides fragilis]
MTITQIIEEINADIIDIKSKGFKYITTNQVPSRHDVALTFERNEDKVGKEINTCVLYVDIRNSVELNKKHHTHTMGRIYSIFSKSILKLAKHHNGSVRNIIGDRVMVVFPCDNCFSNAVNCAISINHISHDINNHFKDVDFRCGIGIDFGLLKVIKVGLHRKGTENIDNKNLVWVGYPANLASRLTDMANKNVNHSSVEVSYYPYNFRGLCGISSLLSPFPQRRVRSNESVYQESSTKKTHSLEDFAKCLSYNETLGVCYSGGKLIKFEKKRFTNRIPCNINDRSCF